MEAEVKLRDEDFLTEILGRVGCIRVTATEVNDNVAVLLALSWESTFVHQVASQF